jgi:hypothetical protein
MIPEGFVQALVDYAEAIGDSSVLETERDKLYARIAAGESGALVNSTINGKTFGWSASTMTVEEKFQAFVQALKILGGTAVSTTYAAFSCLQR